LWSSWLTDLQKWALVPGFFARFTASLTCRTLFFVLLSPSKLALSILTSDADMKLVQERPTEALWSIGAELLETPSSDDVRLAMLKLGILPRLLSYLSELCKMKPRIFGSVSFGAFDTKSVEEIPEQTISTDVAGPTTELTNNSDNQSLANPPLIVGSSSQPQVPVFGSATFGFGGATTGGIPGNKKKGVGYGSDSTGFGQPSGSTWDPALKRKNDLDIEESISTCLVFLAKFLGSCTVLPRWTPGVEVYDLLQASVLLPYLESILRQNSLLELGKHEKLYVLSFFKFKKIIYKNIIFIGSLRFWSY
jgi:hypothetical protein